MVEWLGIATAVLIGLAVGARLPDVDLAPVGLWRHRSAWTHGPLLPLGALWLSALHPLWWWFCMGALPALAVHLLSDALPKAWNGGALIKFYPLPFSLPAFFSLAYIASGAVMCGYVFWRLLQ